MAPGRLFLLVSLAVGVLFVSVAGASDQTRLLFPRLGFQPGVSTEGYAFVNPGGSAATLRFTAYGPAGQVVGTPAERVWAAGHQAAFQAEGVLGLTGAAEGWVEVESNRSGLSGLYRKRSMNPIWRGGWGTGRIAGN